MLETRDESGFTHTVEGIGLFRVDLASEVTGSSLRVVDACVDEAVCDGSEDE
jgi:hypothetical protein